MQQGNMRPTAITILENLVRHGEQNLHPALFLLTVSLDDARSAILQSNLVDVILKMFQRDNIASTEAAINFLKILVQYSVSFFSSVLLSLTVSIDNTRAAVLQSNAISLLVNWLNSDEGVVNSVAADVIKGLAKYGAVLFGIFQSLLTSSKMIFEQPFFGLLTLIPSSNCLTTIPKAR
jgi:hypothetical protein